MNIKKVVVHCSDTPPNMDIGVTEIRKWHKDKGWSDIGYHYVIRRSGSLEFGRDLDGDGEVEDEIGAHVYGHNRGTLGICLIGGMGGCNFTFAQYLTLAGLLKDIKARYRLDKSDIVGHRDLDDSKECPTFDVRSFIAEWD